MEIENVISHLQIIHTWVTFALEKDNNFFEEAHMKRIAEWTEDTIALLKGQDNEIDTLKTLLLGYEAGAINLHRREQMKTTKDECDKAYAETRLELSDKKCKDCEFYHTCKYIFWSYEDVIYGE